MSFSIAARGSGLAPDDLAVTTWHLAWVVPGRYSCSQDKLAFWSALYFQLLSSFAINGSFLASDGNLLASLAAAVLLRTGPLMLAELRARTAAAAESGGGSEGGGGK